MAVASVDDYIEGFPPDVRERLEKIRAAIHVPLPDAEEKIRYGMPAVMFGGRYAVHFAAWKKHIGLYPIPTLDEPLESEIAPYRVEKDSVTFPYSQPIPYDLIERVTAAIVARR